MNPGILAALGAYICWGLLPVYWKLLSHVPAPELLSHRIVWSFAALGLFLLASKRLGALWRTLSPAIWRIYFWAAALVGVNWFIYVWSVNAGYIVEASLGYFITPLLSVFLGIFFFKERLRRLQWIPLFLACSGVLYLTVSYGHLPWIALSLAITFSLYGMAKKKAPLGAFEGLTLETALLVPMALGWLVWNEYTGAGAFLHTSLRSDLLLMGAGIVTTLPLVMFAAATHRVPLSMIGMLQYVAPTIQFLIGVCVYKESFTSDQSMGFGLVWAAVLIFWLERWIAGRGLRRLV